MTQSTTVPPYQPRVLVLEDDQPMRSVMKRNVDDESRLKVVYAEAIDLAQGWLRSSPFDVVSLDMRMPEKVGGVVKTELGVAFARNPITQKYTGKPLVYSGTIEIEAAKGKPGESLQVAGLNIPDKYAKAGKSLSASDGFPFESLSVRDWAERVSAYAFSTSPTLPDKRNFEGVPLKSSLGAWLHSAPQTLPAVLARQARELGEHWGQTKGMIAAYRFAQCCTQLAMAQTAMVLAAEGLVPKPPDNYPWKQQINALRGWSDQHSVVLGHWNWAQWLTPEELGAMDALCELRNDHAHDIQVQNERGQWAGLLGPLRHLMRLASFWATHPLCMDIQATREGQKATTLATTGLPLPRRQLDADAPFPSAALPPNDSVWQMLWRCDTVPDFSNDELPPPWLPRPIEWAPEWLSRSGNDKVELRVWRNKTSTEWLDLVSGESRRTASDTAST